MGEAIGRAVARQASGGGRSFGTLGAIFNGMGGYTAGSGASAASGHTTLNALLDRIMGSQGAMPTAPQMTPNLVDVNAVTAPFGQYRDATNAQYATNRSRLDELAAAGIADGQMVQAATANRLADLERLRQADIARNAGVVEQAANASQGDLAAQGVDPALMAAHQASVNDRAAEAASNAQGGLNLVSDMKAQNEIAAARRQSEDSLASRGANTTLDQNLFAAMASLNAQEQAARMQAEQFNAEATAQAQQANYQGQMADFTNAQAQADRNLQLPSALMEAGASMGAFTNPKRDSIARQLAGAPPNSFRSALFSALQKFDNPEDAKAEALNALDAVNAYNEKNNRPQISAPNLDRWIEDWYYQDGTMSNQGFTMLGRQFGVR